MSYPCDCWAHGRPTMALFLAQDALCDAQGAGPAARLCSEMLPLGGFLAAAPSDLSRSLAPEPDVFGERTTAFVTACCGHLHVCAMAGHWGWGSHTAAGWHSYLEVIPAATKQRCSPIPLLPDFVLSSVWSFSRYSRKLPFELLYPQLVNSNGKSEVMLPAGRIVLPVSCTSPFNETRHVTEVCKTIALILFPPELVAKQFTPFSCFTD